LKNFALPNPTPIFLGFLAPPSKTGHFDFRGLGTESAKIYIFWGQKTVIFGPPRGGQKEGGVPQKWGFWPFLGQKVVKS
jgi:hypothetical protein